MIEGIAAGQLLTAGSNVLGAAVARPPEQSTALSGGTVNSWLDASGWTVATGKSTSQGGSRSDAVGGISPLMIAAAVVGLLVWKLAKS